MKTAVVGASGYAGGELLRLLAVHPKFEITCIAAGSNAGEFITDLHPQLSSFAGRRFETTNLEQINKCDFVFIALPHGESAKLVSQIDKSVKIVDLGADFRLQSSDSWKKYYGGEHAGSWLYGLPELINHKEISKSTQVSNPGCYATAIALSVAPVLSHIDSADVVVVAASGTTGAGRSARVNLMGSEVMNNLSSYKFGGIHQHTPEIEELLSKVGKKDVKISFTPILAPMPRGILATVTAKLIDNSDSETVRELFSNYYKNSKFVTVLPAGSMPMTNAVLGSNNAQIQVAVDEHVNRVVISAAIDNLGKGAAGQAIQNANLMCDFAEDLGLQNLGVR